MYFSILRFIIENMYMAHKPIKLDMHSKTKHKCDLNLNSRHIFIFPNNPENSVHVLKTFSKCTLTKVKKNPYCDSMNTLGIM